MKALDISLERIYKQLIDGNAGMAIAEMETYLAAWPQPQTTERLLELKEDYTLLAGYWRQGVEDPQRQEQYQRLLQRVYLLFSNVAVYRHLQASSFLIGLYQQARQSQREWTLAAIRGEMENFVSEIAMLEFEPENKRADKRRELYKEHQQQMNTLFNYVLTSRMWTEGVGRGFTELLLSPTVDSIDQQQLVSAITLSLMNHFDMVKFRLLVDVYRQSQDESMLYVYPEQKALIDELLESDKVCEEITELQMQLVYTLNAEKDNETIRQEIMPDLMKNDAFHITRNGIEEMEEDPLEDILHPDASERRIEKLEASMQRMIDMQKQGADIYFAGFAQMKRYPFFYDISNWMVPFYIQHPDIQQFVDRMEYHRFVASILDKGPFCNSDKYSFVIAANQVFGQLPESVRNLMKHNEASLGELEIGESQTAAYIRRIYLMDLYRFFRLFPNRSALCNPFEEQHMEVSTLNLFRSELLKNTPLDAYKHSVIRLMKKFRFEKMAKEVLYTFPEEQKDAQYYLWMGLYSEALDLEPDNERALSGAARDVFLRGDYEKACEYYDRLLLLYPGKTGYMLNKSVCHVKLKDYEEALKLLYQLDYEHPDEVNIQRVFAWTLTCDDKLEQAEKQYRQLESEQQATAEDYMNYGYCLWLLNRIDDAAARFRKYVELTPEEKKPYLRLFDSEWLAERGIDHLQICMMDALVRA